MNMASPTISYSTISPPQSPVISAHPAALFPLLEGTTSSMLTSVALNAIAQNSSVINSFLLQKLPETEFPSGQIRQPEAQLTAVPEIPASADLSNHSLTILNRRQRYELEGESINARIAAMEVQLQGPVSPVEPNPEMDEIETRVHTFQRETEVLILELTQNSACCP